MIWLEDKVEIKASPEQIFDWFAHLEENYLAWHPQDHIEWRTLKGNLMEAGSTFYFAERIGERTLRMKCRITGVEPNRRVEWAAIGPFSLLGVGGIFPRRADGGWLSFHGCGILWLEGPAAGPGLRLGGPDVPFPPNRGPQATYGRGGAEPEATLGDTKWLKRSF